MRKSEKEARYYELIRIIETSCNELRQKYDATIIVSIQTPAIYKSVTTFEGTDSGVQLAITSLIDDNKKTNIKALIENALKI